MECWSDRLAPKHGAWTRQASAPIVVGPRFASSRGGHRPAAALPASHRGEGLVAMLTGKKGGAKRWRA